MTSEDEQNLNETPPDAGGQSTPAENGSSDSSRYQRSSIRFPYAALSDAEDVVRAVHRDYGGSANPDQLAASMHASPRSGAFRSKLTAAAMFGVAETSRGAIVVTDLGNRLLDPQTRGGARVEAFMNVPLFAALVEEYRGKMLPPIGGLDRKIIDLGVTGKNAARARQSFQRSAELAGFFRHGKDRLVEPPRSLPPDGPGGDRRPTPQNDRGSGTADLPEPLIELWVTLLREGDTWSEAATYEFVQAARKLAELLADGG